MATEKPKLYVGCSLTQAPEAFKSSVEDFKNALRNEGFEVFDFVGLVNGTAEGVYNWDIGHCVRDCDLFVGICDYPSIGLGWELSEATRLGKPVLAIAHEEVKVTRILHGAATVEPNFHFQQYTNLIDIIPRIHELLSTPQ